MSKCLKVSYFVLWFLLWAIASALVAVNVKWHTLTDSELAAAVIIVVTLSVLHVGVAESLTMSLFTVIVGGRRREEARGDCSNLTVVLNYNLLAMTRGDVDECYGRMLAAFMSNLSDKLSAVLLSATSDPSLVQYELACRDKYRQRIIDILRKEGNAYINAHDFGVDDFRRVHLWKALEQRHGLRYLRAHLPAICGDLAREFMCLHRVSRVLKKCGQYQDLMLLSDGYTQAFTYTDQRLYGRYARPVGEDMFYDSDDRKNICGRKFNYTFVLDGDTSVPRGTVHELLGIAAKRPEKGILQPAIQFEAGRWDTIYMNLEDLRQKLNEPVTIAMAKVFDQCGFFGKGLINNRIYIDRILGHPGNPLERVPVNLISHDTYEAVILKPHYVSSVYIVERPTYNYLAWNSRLRRWNVGDIVLSMYFHQYLVGVPIKLLQRCLQGSDYYQPELRTKSPADIVTLYIADSSLRGMFTKPMWMLYVIIHCCVKIDCYYQWLPLVIVLIVIIIVSKIAIFIRCHKTTIYIIPELLSSILQFTPEIVVGCVRFLRVLYVVSTGKMKWVPQRHVEEEFNTLHTGKIFWYSIKHLWGYSLFAVVVFIGMIMIGLYVPTFNSISYLLVFFNLVCIFILPLYCFVTSLRMCPCFEKDHGNIKLADEESVVGYPILESNNYKSELATPYRGGNLARFYHDATGDRSNYIQNVRLHRENSLTNGLYAKPIKRIHRENNLALNTNGHIDRHLDINNIHRDSNGRYIHQIEIDMNQNDNETELKSVYSSIDDGSNRSRQLTKNGTSVSIPIDRSDNHYDRYSDISNMRNSQTYQSTVDQPNIDVVSFGGTRSWIHGENSAGIRAVTTAYQQTSTNVSKWEHSEPSTNVRRYQDEIIHVPSDTPQSGWSDNETNGEVYRMLNDIAEEQERLDNNKSRSNIKRSYVKQVHSIRARNFQEYQKTLQAQKADTAQPSIVELIFKVNDETNGSFPSNVEHQRTLSSSGFYASSKTRSLDLPRVSAGNTTTSSSHTKQMKGRFIPKPYKDFRSRFKVKSNYIKEIADIVSPENIGKSGMQGTFVSYDPRSEDIKASMEQAINASPLEWYRTEKCFQVDSYNNVYSITFNSTKSGSKATKVTERTLETRDAEYSTTDKDVTDSETDIKIVSGVDFECRRLIEASPILRRKYKTYLELRPETEIIEVETVERKVKSYDQKVDLKKSMSKALTDYAGASSLKWNIPEISERVTNMKEISESELSNTDEFKVESDVSSTPQRDSSVEVVKRLRWEDENVTPRKDFAALTEHEELFAKRDYEQLFSHLFESTNATSGSSYGTSRVESEDGSTISDQSFSETQYTISQSLPYQNYIEHSDMYSATSEPTQASGTDYVMRSYESSGTRRFTGSTDLRSRTNPSYRRRSDFDSIEETGESDTS